MVIDDGKIAEIEKNSIFNQSDLTCTYLKKKRLKKTGDLRIPKSNKIISSEMFDIKIAVF